MIKSFKLVLILSMGLPNLIIVSVNVHETVYLLASNAQRIVMIATILAQLQYIDAGMYSVLNVLCLMFFVIISATLEIFGYAVASHACCPMSLVLGTICLVYYLYLAVVWIYGTNINILLIRDENTSFAYNRIIDLLE